MNMIDAAAILPYFFTIGFDKIIQSDTLGRDNRPQVTLTLTLLTLNLKYSDSNSSAYGTSITNITNIEIVEIFSRIKNIGNNTLQIGQSINTISYISNGFSYHFWLFCLLSWLRKQFISASGALELYMNIR